MKPLVLMLAIVGAMIGGALGNWAMQNQQPPVVSLKRKTEAPVVSQPRLTWRKVGDYYEATDFRFNGVRCIAFRQSHAAAVSLSCDFSRPAIVEARQ